MWVINPNLKRKNGTPAKLLADFGQEAFNERMKRAAELRMAQYDSMPKELRAAIGEHGSMPGALLNRFRTPASKVKEYHRLCREKLMKEAIWLPGADAEKSDAERTLFELGL